MSEKIGLVRIEVSIGDLQTCLVSLAFNSFIISNGPEIMEKHREKFDAFAKTITTEISEYLKDAELCH